MMYIAALTAVSLAGVPQGDLTLTHANLEGTKLRYAMDSTSWQGLVVRDAPATPKRVACTVCRRRCFAITSPAQPPFPFPYPFPFPPPPHDVVSELGS